jgi:sugar phosphate permease
LRRSYGWQSALLVPGVLGVVFAVVTGVSLRPCDPPPGSRPPTTLANIVRSLVKSVFTNGSLWLLGLSYFFVSLARTVVVSWAGSLLSSRVGGAAPLLVSWLFVFEAAGIVGGILAGVSRDGCRPHTHTHTHKHTHTHTHTHNTAC